MTRETKIGLLVGLAFIIVIGILLSDHLTSSTEPPPAVLAQTGNNVRQQVASPGGAATPVAATTATPVIIPQRQVPTPRELSQTSPTSIVQIGGPSVATPEVAAPEAPQPPITLASNPPAAPEVKSSKSALAQIAAQHGEAIVPTDSAASEIERKQLAIDKALAGPATSKDYVALPGDSVSKMATRFLGSNTKANRDAIIAANPALHGDVNKVIVGKTYHIPSGNSKGSALAIPAPILNPNPHPTMPVVAADANNYTVQPGDSLWKIANEQVGDAGAIAAIKELNKDVLKGGDSVRPNMVLRLPSKAVAQVN